MFPWTKVRLCPLFSSPNRPKVPKVQRPLNPKFNGIGDASHGKWVFGCGSPWLLIIWVIIRHPSKTTEVRQTIMSSPRNHRRILLYSKISQSFGKKISIHPTIHPYISKKNLPPLPRKVTTTNIQDLPIWLLWLHTTITTPSSRSDRVSQRLNPAQQIAFHHALLLGPCRWSVEDGGDDQ